MYIHNTYGFPESKSIFSCDDQVQPSVLMEILEIITQEWAYFLIGVDHLEVMGKEECTLWSDLPLGVLNYVLP